MIGELRLWPKKLEDGIKAAKTFYEENHSSIPKKIENIFFVGMGGSGIAGRILKTFLDSKGEIQTTVIEGTAIPSYIPKNSLFIAISYSGNTWETLKCIQKIISLKIPLLILSNGGAAQELAKEHNILFLEVPASKTPRSALGIFLGILLELFDKLNILDGKRLLKGFKIQLAQYLEGLEDQAKFKDFLVLASKKDFFHIFGVAGDSASCAFRAQTQFNENSKIPAVFSAFPELCHNLLVGFSETNSNPLILLFHTDFLSQDLKTDIKIVEEILAERGVALYKPSIFGDTWEEQLFYIILWSDYASYFLAKLKGVDVAPVKIIDLLKSRQKKYQLGGC